MVKGARIVALRCVTAALIMVLGPIAVPVFARIRTRGSIGGRIRIADIVYPRE